MYVSILLFYYLINKSCSYSREIKSVKEKVLEAYVFNLSNKVFKFYVTQSNNTALVGDANNNRRKSPRKIAIIVTKR